MGPMNRGQSSRFLEDDERWTPAEAVLGFPPPPMNITNKTPKPLSVPLPGGKKLFLGPGKTGQVTAKAMVHPPLVKLLESGDIVSSEETSPRAAEANRKFNPPAATGSGSGGAPGGAPRQSGDR